MLDSETKQKQKREEMLVQELQMNFGFEELCTIFWWLRIVKDITFVLYLCLIKFIQIIRCYQILTQN